MPKYAIKHKIMAENSVKFRRKRAKKSERASLLAHRVV